MLVSVVVMHDDGDADTAAFLRLVGRRVKASREAGGLTQSRLERDAGLRPTTIAALERGEQDLDVYDLYRVAGALGVDMRALLPSDEEIGGEAAPDVGDPGGR
jgi:transcriptional regulator with XRE-family HTH domain